MKPYTVITSFNSGGLKSYGQRMINTFESLWPQEVDLIIYAEDCQPTTSRQNTRIIDLLKASKDLRDFITRHHDNPMAHGRAGPLNTFNPKKAFRWDAVRFSYKVFSIAHATSSFSDGWMIWLDADTHTHSPLTLPVLENLCPNNSMISYLGRGENYHSECGWVGYNLSHPSCQEFISTFVNMYRNDDIFNFPEWHDSYVWDQIRKRYQNTNYFHNLTPTNFMGRGVAGHPFINSKLGRYMDHVKGSRKIQGHSERIDIKNHHDLPYWQNILGKKI